MAKIVQLNGGKCNDYITEYTLLLFQRYYQLPFQELSWVKSVLMIYHMTNYLKIYILIRKIPQKTSGNLDKNSTRNKFIVHIGYNIKMFKEI